MRRYEIKIPMLPFTKYTPLQWRGGGKYEHRDVIFNHLKWFLYVELFLP